MSIQGNAAINKNQSAQSLSDTEQYSPKKFIQAGPPPGPLSESVKIYFPGMEFRPVRNVDELLEAAKVVYDEYVRMGYTKANKDGWRLSPFHLLPKTVTMVARHPTHGILQTITCMVDSPMGLPIENVFPLETQNLRLEDRKIFEIGMLASNDQAIKALGLSPATRLLLLFHLIRAALDDVRMNFDVDTLVECCHPTHDNFYKMLGLERLGGLGFHGGVHDNPALAGVLRLPEAAASGVKDGLPLHIFIRLFLRDLPLEGPHSPLQFSPSEFERLFVEHRNILASIPPHKLAYVKTCYPDLDIDYLARSKSVLSYLIDAIDHIPNVPDDASSSNG